MFEFYLKLFLFLLCYLKKSTSRLLIIPLLFLPVIVAENNSGNCFFTAPSANPLFLFLLISRPAFLAQPFLIKMIKFNKAIRISLLGFTKL